SLENELTNDFSDSISLVEVQGEAHNISIPHEDFVTPRRARRSVSRRGRSRKSRGRSKHKSSILGVPKFLHLMEVTREGGGKNKRLKNGTEVEKDPSCREQFAIGGNRSDFHEDVDCSQVPETVEGLNLEVVLPGIDTTPSSGINL
ncbi:hypothetical protein A2U01_0038646, partial [Trifolium medium]|nr:hypothetical protein [Trifolium medium]